MAYPRYIGKSAFASGTGALTVAALTGTQAGDIIILFAESANQTISTPTGYSVLATQIGTGTAAAAGGVRIATFYRVMQDAADTTTTVADSGDHTTAIKMLFRDTALAIGNLYASATSTQAATTAMVFPSVTTLTDESLVVLAVAQDTDAASTATVGALTNANLSSLTERHDQTVTSGAGGGLAVITGQKATAGATGTSTATGSTSVTHAYTTISLSRIAAQTTTSTFNDLPNVGTSYYPISDAMRLTAGSAGTVDATSSGTFQPDVLAGGTYAVNFKWYWRQLGTDTWTTSTAQASSISAVAIGGSLDTLGEFTDNETISGLTNGVEYEFVLFAAKSSAYGASILFSATASVALPSSNVTVSITGQAVSVAQGSVNESNAVGITGQSASVAQGSVAKSNSIGISGQAISIAQGAVAESISVGITGQSVSVSQGTVVAVVGSADVTVSITGLNVAIAQGSVSSSSSKGITGQGVAVAIGNVSVSHTRLLAGVGASIAQGSLGKSISIAITGQALASAQGLVTPANSVSQTGQSVSVSQGTVVASVSTGNVTVSITGLSVSIAQNSLAPSVSLSVNGISAGFALGTVGTAKSVGITGQSTASAQGSVGKALSKSITGQSVSVAQGSVGKASSVGISGQGASLSQGSLTESLAVSITGLSGSLSQGSVSATVSGSVAVSITGLGVTLSQGVVKANIDVSLEGEFVTTAITLGGTPIGRIYLGTIRIL